ncbi:YciI family protein [Halioxenophilus sp. WMMB6]|uniref:YciI family protein n=1 Tax=Halioxenophilus sp. WMMB6 TaxID=3073815 RepID=UPI00295E4F43|nr:YciI family protein [Halioxenophilus sp. WMMB6]
MWYSVVGTDTPGSLAKRLEARPAHLERVKALQDAGRLLVAGPNPAADTTAPGEAGFTGSIIIAEFASLADAEAWANADPYVLAGVYQSVSVKPFIKVLP